ncbi:MAG: Rrf2 family transcriptional regulator [Oscillospiraceae bacterium]|nr:Rrf2 family transcriptional regulator [Oscillospiraceae bacterium]
MVRIRTKGRYALRIMLDLAQQQTDAFIPLKEITERQGISIKYGEMIIGLLSKAGLVYSSRGKGGGYKLSRPAEEYSVGSVLKASEGSLAPVSCLELPKNICPSAEHCETLPLWTELGRRIDEYLESVTISDLVNQTSIFEKTSCIGSHNL